MVTFLLILWKASYLYLQVSLDCFKQTHCRLQIVNRNDGTKVKPLVRRHDEYELYGVCTQKYVLDVGHRCIVMEV